MGFRYDTFCGLYCGACDVLQANRSGRVEALAQAWGMEPEALQCHGCKTEVNAVYCVECGIKACAESRGLEHCTQCADYACARLMAFWSDGCAHHALAQQSLERLHQQGLARWLEEQRARWACPRCGVASSWYDAECGACGARLFSCTDEESQRAGGETETR
jgi:hypothetical protein